MSIALEQLWIDFKLCSYFWFDNYAYYKPTKRYVVNWFQIMFLFLVRQPQPSMEQPAHRCELISNYVLIFGSTTSSGFSVNLHLLWIDFKLCSYFWFDNLCSNWNGWNCVVNWFQIMFLFLVRQQISLHTSIGASCELISNYVLIFGSTTTTGVAAKNAQLWIDFKLCSYFWFDNFWV